MATQSPNSSESFIGSFISLISKHEIRYEGVLYFLNVQDSIIGLNNVRSYGTEGRRKDGQQVPPSDKVYDYILFRGSDIKNLQIKSPSTSVRAEEQIFSDQAIIQSQHTGVPSSPAASVCGRSLTESIQRQDSTAKSSKALPVGLPSHLSVTELGPSNQSADTQGSSHPSFSTSMYWQGHSGTSSNSSHSLLQPSSIQPMSMVPPFAMQNLNRTAETQEPTKVGWTTSSEYGVPVSSATTSIVNPTRSPSPTSLQISDSLVTPSLLSTTSTPKTSMPYSMPLTTDGSNMSSFFSSLQDINSREGRISGKICPQPSPIYPRHSVRNPGSSFVDSTFGLLPTPQPLLTSNQFAHHREQLLAHNSNPNSKDMDSPALAPSRSSVLMPSPASQAPLLPLPTSMQKAHYSVSQFTEDFDFAAMNEKFKKEEVWSSLGKATTKIERMEDYASLNLGDREFPDLKSAYKKDDFFDTISCNSMTGGSRNGKNHLSARIKQATERFGNFHQRPNVGYGDYGAGQGENIRGSHYLGRGYGDYGAGQGENFRGSHYLGRGYGDYGAGQGENFRGSHYLGRGYGNGGRGRGPNFPF